MKTNRSAPFVVSLLLGYAAGLAPAPAAAAEISNVPQIRVDREVGAAKSLSLEVGQNRLLVLSEAIGRVSVADPKVADLKVITPTQLLMTARGVGSTDLTLWNKHDEPLVLALAVSRNLEGLRRQLKDLFPDEKITVSAAGDLVVLSGSASDVRVPERALEVAQLHAERVANLIRVGGNQQVIQWGEPEQNNTKVGITWGSYFGSIVLVGTDGKEETYPFAVVAKSQEGKPTPPVVIGPDILGDQLPEKKQSPPINQVQFGHVFRPLWGRHSCLPTFVLADKNVCPTCGSLC